MPIYQIYLCDQNEQYVNELQRIRPCYGIYNMAVITGNIFDLRADAIVVPTNTFGFMTSNFELSCINLFGISIQNELHKKIKKTNMQELLVGQSICIKTNNYKLKNCIFSPIIRIPNILTDVYPIYLATKSAVLCAIENNFEELTETLKSLGYKPNDIKKVLPKLDASLSLEKQVKEALKLLLR